MSTSEIGRIWANHGGPADSLELIKIPRVKNETQGFLEDPEKANLGCVDGTAWNPPVLSSSDSLVWLWSLLTHKISIIDGRMETSLAYQYCFSPVFVWMCLTNHARWPSLQDLRHHYHVHRRRGTDLRTACRLAKETKANWRATDRVSFQNQAVSGFLKKLMRYL